MTSSNPKTARALFPHVIIPAWLALGATFKMLESDARLLPKSVLQTLGNLGLTEGNLLSYSLAGMVGIEFLLAGLMFTRSAFARPAAAATLGLFCLILGVELAGGADSCGCLGAWSPHPAVMLGIDGGLLLGLLLTWGRAGRTTKEGRAWGMGLAAAAMAAVLRMLGHQTARLTLLKMMAPMEPTRPPNSSPHEPQNPDLRPIGIAPTLMPTWAKNGKTSRCFDGARSVPMNQPRTSFSTQGTAITVKKCSTLILLDAMT